MPVTRADEVAFISYAKAVMRLPEERGSLEFAAARDRLIIKHLAAHRETEREQIVEHLTPLAEVVHKTWGVAECNGFTMAIDEIKRMTTTTPPEPRELTAEIVKEMLPANRTPWCADAPGWARYESPLGFIQWQYTGGEIELWINGMCLSLETIGTDRKLAALIAAFGIGVGVKHG